MGSGSTVASPKKLSFGISRSRTRFITIHLGLFHPQQPTTIIPGKKKSSNSYHQDPNPQSVDHHPSLTSNAVLSSSGTEFCMQEIPSSSSIPAKPLPNLPSLGHVQKEPSIPTDLPVPDWKERWQEIKLKLESLEPVERDICIQEVWKIVLAHQRSSQIPSSSLSSQINPQLQHDSRLLTGN